MIHHQSCAESSKRGFRHFRNEVNRNFPKVKPGQADGSGGGCDNDCNDQGHDSTKDAQNTVGVLRNNHKKLHTEEKLVLTSYTENSR